MADYEQLVFGFRHCCTVQPCQRNLESYRGDGGAYLNRWIRIYGLACHIWKGSD